MVQPAPGVAGAEKEHKKRMVVRFRSETATGIKPGKDSAPAGQFHKLPKGVSALHSRFGVKSLQRVGRTASAARAGSRKTSARAPRIGAATATTLRTQFNRTAVLELSPGADVSQALADYRANPDVEWAEPVRVLQIQAVPNDPSFATL